MNEWIQRIQRFLITALALSSTTMALSGSPRQSLDVRKDVVFASVDGKSLGLDLYLPADVKSPPLLVWVHGGAWTSGTKAGVPAKLLQGGMAVASVDFRQSTEA